MIEEGGHGAQSEGEKVDDKAVGKSEVKENSSKPVAEPSPRKRRKDKRNIDQDNDQGTKAADRKTVM